jgi:hypothetical protein
MCLHQWQNRLKFWTLKDTDWKGLSEVFGSTPIRFCLFIGTKRVSQVVQPSSLEFSTQIWDQASTWIVTYFHVVHYFAYNLHIWGLKQKVIIDCKYEHSLIWDNTQFEVPFWGQRRGLPQEQFMIAASGVWRTRFILPHWTASALHVSQIALWFTRRSQGTF